ncbi:hypothetical protein BABINDRAFT_159337 [Babjeviella inositovora NRRL Y-12698]|uniref:rRNA adenine N(6)-methyltransferase n=1 Tax=Babjeviella inositovora NRRL Y-12698 TaxID=984486 RepID=A0A1E3QYU2_9ASCO|nr:uncharacterized protein BABINDRAFT_159337 [Babjeviella inositovora NRRL Y-12698]ODQ82840.1 hypothetical protein BABINDRAFT_159337 [Babjeviella inositovora NRRL Y-12698]
MRLIRSISLSLNVSSTSIFQTMKPSRFSAAISNPYTVAKILQKVALRDTYGSDLAILDIFPNNGLFSGLVNEHLKPHQHVVMGSEADFHGDFYAKINAAMHTNLQKAVKDPRHWESYSEMIAEGYLTPRKAARTNLHPAFLISANITNPKYAEKTLMRWLGCIGNRNWLQKYGRARMLVWTNAATASKLLAPAGSPKRGRLAIFGEQFTDTTLVATTAPKSSETWSAADLARYDPILLEPETDYKVHSMTQEISLLDIKPCNHALDLDSFEYVVKQLMMLRNVRLETALMVLGAGSKEYFSEQLSGVLQRKPRELTADEWVLVSKTFSMWPFKPEFLFDHPVENEEVEAVDLLFGMFSRA